jgi:hypothetical protein
MKCLVGLSGYGVTLGASDKQGNTYMKVDGNQESHIENICELDIDGKKTNVIHKCP